MRKFFKDLTQSQDGSYSLTKIAASTAHVLMAGLFAKLSLEHGFLPELWTLYGGVSIGHAVIDKTVAQFKNFKEQVLNTPPTKDPADDQQPSPQGPSV